MYYKFEIIRVYHFSKGGVECHRYLVFKIFISIVINGILPLCYTDLLYKQLILYNLYMITVMRFNEMSCSLFVSFQALCCHAVVR